MMEECVSLMKVKRCSKFGTIMSYKHRCTHPYILMIYKILPILYDDWYILCIQSIISCGSWLEEGLVTVHRTSAHESCKLILQHSIPTCFSVKCRLLKEATSFNETPWTLFSKCWSMLKTYLWRAAFVPFCERHASEKCRGDREIARVAIKHHGTKNLWRSGVSGCCVCTHH